MSSNPEEKKIRVLLAEDHTLVRQGFRRILEDDPHITVVGEAGTGLAAIEQTKTLKPDVIIMDLAMPELGGLEASAEILKFDPDMKILILSMYSNEAYVRKALDIGARGYVLKNAIEVDLTRAVLALAEGHNYLSPEVSKVVIENMKSGPRGEPGGEVGPFLLQSRDPRFDIGQFLLLPETEAGTLLGLRHGRGGA